MTQTKRREPSLKKKAESDGVSLVYLWLQRRHRHVESIRMTAPRPWHTIAKEMAAEGVRNHRGVLPTRKNVEQAWARLQRELTARAAAKAAAPTRIDVRRRGPNVEPPSRPPPPDTGIRLPSEMTFEPLGWRERHPEIYSPPALPARDPVGQGFQPKPPSAALTGKEKIERLRQKMRDMNGYVPPPITRGKVV